MKKKEPFNVYQTLEINKNANKLIQVKISEKNNDFFCLAYQKSIEIYKID